MICLLAGLLLPASSFAAPVPDYPIDILIDVGHGGIDGGASHGDILEKDINLAVGKLLYEGLLSDGYQVVINRTGDYALSDDNDWLKSSSRHTRDLAQRRHLAKELRPQVLISLHVNWSRSADAHGPVVLYQHNNQSYMLAGMVQHSLNQLYRTQVKPQVGKTYYLLRHSICPAIIVEMGFISNASDRSRLLNPKERALIAVSIRDAVREYFMLTGELRHAPPKETLIQIMKRLFERLY